MLVIASAAYSEPSLCSEFGDVPPSFLPIGPGRLCALQARWARRWYDDILMTLPDDFPVSPSDQRQLASHRIRLAFSDRDATLAQSLSAILGGRELGGRLDILFGDTLLPSLEPQADSLVLADRSDSGDDNWAGFFAFSTGAEFMRCLQETGDFNTAVELYDRRRAPLTRIVQGRCHDFGQLHTYHRSRQEVTTERHFNSLSIVEGVVTKRSEDRLKMAAECVWFEQAPPEIREYLPNYLGRTTDAVGVAGYRLEYQPQASLAELQAFGSLPLQDWQKILALCLEYIRAEQSVEVPVALDLDAVEGLFFGKTRDRLQEHALQAEVSLEEEWVINGVAVPGLTRIVEEAWLEVASGEPIPSFTHGDFCFSNILHDSHSCRITVVDPRGLDWQGRVGAFSDLRYDVAKLAHSALGKYDLIVAGRADVEFDGHDVSLEIDDASTRELHEYFESLVICGRTLQELKVYPAMILLFLSMLPKHRDDPVRQASFLANALRLYAEHFG